jgi:outer membrane protein TolC
VDSVLAWLIAQRRAIEAERQLITLRRVRLDNRVNLHLALGGGFEPETKEPSP